MAGGRRRKAAAPARPAGRGRGRRGRGQSVQRPTGSDAPEDQNQAIPQSLGELLALVRREVQRASEPVTQPEPSQPQLASAGQQGTC